MLGNLIQGDLLLLWLRNTYVLQMNSPFNKLLTFRTMILSSSLQSQLRVDNAVLILLLLLRK